MNSSDSTTTLGDKIKFGIAGPIIIYGLFFAGLLHVVLPIVGLVLAYFLRRDSQGYLQSHFTYLIRTFWIALGFYIGICAIALVMFFPAFKSLFSLESTGSTQNQFTLNVLGNSVELYGQSPFAFTTDVIAFMVILIVLSVAFVVWYLVRLGMGVRALYLGREAL